MSAARRGRAPRPVRRSRRFRVAAALAIICATVLLTTGGVATASQSVIPSPVLHLVHHPTTSPTGSTSGSPQPITTSVLVQRLVRRSGPGDQRLPRSDRTAPGPSYGVGPGYCNQWKGLSHDRISAGGVYPCANPKVHDAWGATGASDFVNRYEWADDGLVARVAAGDVVRDLRTVHKVPIGAMGHKQLPGCGDVISMFGGARTRPAGFAGVVVAVNVSATGTGTITYLDEDGTLYHGLSYGEDHLRVAAWRISTGWKGSAAYTQFDWTLQTSGWQCASEVPGTAKLNAGGNGGVNSVSCASPGNSAAGGGYEDSSGSSQAFVADEVAGTWKPAVEVPGSATLNVGENAGVNSVSSASPGNCAAGGWYSSSLGKSQAFVADEVAGTWKPAVEVPGSATLNVGENAGVGSVSCASPGNSAAGGWYSLLEHSQAFVADEVAGTWKPAIEVPGSAKLNVGGVAEILSVSCASPGSCAAGGDYEDSSGSNQAWVADEVAGTWGPVIEVPGTAALSAGGHTEGAALTAISSVSCASPGDCVAGGYEAYVAGREAIVALEIGGVWQRATEVPGTSVFNAGGGAEILSVSCASPGNCAAGGGYEDRSRRSQALVADEVGS